MVCREQNKRRANKIRREKNERRASRAEMVQQGISKRERKGQGKDEGVEGSSVMEQKAEEAKEEQARGEEP